MYGHRYGHILSVLVPNRFGAGHRAASRPAMCLPTSTAASVAPLRAIPALPAGGAVPRPSMLLPVSTASPTTIPQDVSANTTDHAHVAFSGPHAFSQVTFPSERESAFRSFVVSPTLTPGGPPMSLATATASISTSYLTVASKRVRSHKAEEERPTKQLKDELTGIASDEVMGSRGYRK